MDDFEDEVDCDWTELLPQNSLFEQLREEGSDVLKSGNLVCEIRGDLFVWSAAKSALLTTNLKRLKAHPAAEQTFQTLVCTTAPLTPVTHLLPDASGMHIALVSRQAISVLKLAHSRGEHGEFGGGQSTVNCRVTPVATDLFTIHHHTLHLLQAHWHPSLPHCLLLLTSDSTMRLFSLADPNITQYSVPLTPSAANPVHGCTLEDSIVSFACVRDKLFALRDTGDVVMCPLSPRATPPQPLPMHPMSEDNYGNEATALLVLETTPLTLIIAHSSGTLYHCLFLEGDKEGGSEGEEGIPQTVSDNLYVVESAQLDLQEEDASIMLTRDPVLPYRYFTSHGDGVHMITLPWLNRVDQFTTTNMEELTMRADSEVEHLIATEDPEITRLQGVAYISEPLLGATLVVLTSDLECLVLSLPSPPPAHFVVVGEATPTKPRPQVKPDSSGFEKIIRDILEEYQDAPILRHSQAKDLSQQECFDFLQHSIQKLRTKYLIPQKKAKAMLQHRLDILCRQKEQQLRDLVALGDERVEIEERSEEVRGRVEDVRRRAAQLTQRLERLVCQLDAQSPFLSDAEVDMGQELNRLSSQLQKKHNLLEEAKRKLRLGYAGSSRAGAVGMSQAQRSNVCGVLMETGKRLVALKLQIKSLLAAVP